MTVIGFISIYFFNTNQIIAQKLNRPLAGDLGTFAVPMEIGNVWNYKNYYFQPEFKIELFDTVRINGNLYYSKRTSTNTGYIETYDYLRLRDDGYYVKYDSITLFRGIEYMYYKQNLKKGDTWNQVDATNHTWYHNVIDTTNISSFWGASLPVKVLEITDSSLTTYLEYWSDEFGLIRQQTDEFGSGGLYLLWGCYVNGMQYGDTTLVTIENEVITTPFFCELDQNYPNPFNPITIIKYEIPKISNIKLEIFDVLGRNIKTLVNDEKPAGRYEVEFDASLLASGIYYYRIKANDFIQTKKMMLMK